MRLPCWLLVLGLAACVGDADVEVDDENGTEYVVPAQPWPSDPLRFEAECSAGSRLTIAAVGDVLLHSPLQRQAVVAPTRFASLWAAVGDLLARADLTYANLEGPTAAGVNRQGREVTDPGLAFDDVVYTSYPMFNYNPALVDDLFGSGVDIVSTSNNHSLDRWSLGATKTLDELDRVGLAHTGTRRADDTTSPWYAVTTAGDFTIAWLACTYATNGIPDREDQVLGCWEDAAVIEALIAELAARPEHDAVIVTPHWGDEYHAAPNQAQVQLGHRFLEAGATAILGSHPHVLEPWEKYVTADGRETFVIYSLGNFVSGQNHLPRRSTLLLYLGLVRDTEGVVRIHGVRYVPLHMSLGGTTIGVQAVDRVGGHADSRALTTAMFGEHNLLPADAPVVFEDPDCELTEPTEPAEPAEPSE